MELPDSSLISQLTCTKTPKILCIESLQFSLIHALTLGLFICAIVHVFCVNQIHRLARDYEDKLGPKRERKDIPRQIGIQILYFLSEVEVVFAFWAIPLFAAIALTLDWKTAVQYFNSRDYTEPLFVVIIMSLASTKPIINLAEKIIHTFANWLGGSISAWWFTLLSIGPILGSFITEVGAMAITALLLSRQFYEYRPSSKLSYATLGLLFVNISVGGILTDFASPPVLVLAHYWDWNILFMIKMFGWKAVLGILLSNALFWFHFRKELKELERRKEAINELEHRVEELEKASPVWVTLCHVLLIVWVVINSHSPVIFVGSFVFFLGFHQATKIYQYPVQLTRPVLIGLFLAGLAIHGGLQGWWVIRLLENLSPLGVLGVSILMTAFNDNTAIAYLATLMPSWSTAFQYALFSGVVAGGGLTVIANAPNPAGYAYLSKHFENGISALKLFQAAFIPTLILYIIYFLTGPFL